MFAQHANDAELFNPCASLDVEWDVPCHVNGQDFSLRARGRGNGASGTLEVSVEFSSLPEGFDPWVVTAWTSSDTLLFMQENEGAANFLRLTGGFYRVMRIIDLGGGNYLDCIWEKQRVDDKIVTTGSVRGQVQIPTIVAALNMRETLRHLDQGIIFGEFRTTFVTQDSGSIKPRVHGLYIYDTQRQMPCNQVRTANVEAINDGLRFDISYKVAVQPTPKDALVSP